MNYNNIKIYVDDVREIPEGYIGTRSVNQTIEFIKEIEDHNGSIDVIDLDHDLGDYAYDGGDAIKIMDFLVERETLYPVEFHTANPVAREYMERMKRRYWPK